MTLTSVRQRNPSRPNRHRRQTLSGIEQIIDQGARSPTRRRASSNISLEEITRLCNELEASRAARSQRSVQGTPMLRPNVNMMDFASPIPSEPPASSPTSPFPEIPQPCLVNDGDMIRITLQTRRTRVPCIVRCCLKRQSSVADEDFVRAWDITLHPVPRLRRESRGATRYCTLDMVDVEKVGSTSLRLNMPTQKFSDRRFSVALGVDALTSLGLIGTTGPRSTPGHMDASVEFDIPPSLHPGDWSRDLMPSASPEPQRPSNLTLRIPQIPQIRVDSSLLDLPGGSTSAEDSGSNSDMYSLISFEDGTLSPVPWSPASWSPAPSELDMDTARYD